MYFVKARQEISTSLQVALTYQQSLDEIKTESFKLLPSEKLTLLAHIVKYTQNQKTMADLKQDSFSGSQQKKTIDPSIISETVKKVLPDSEIAHVDSTFMQQIHQAAINLPSKLTMRSIVSVIQPFIHFGSTSFHVGYFRIG